MIVLVGMSIAGLAYYNQEVRKGGAIAKLYVQMYQSGKNRHRSIDFYGVVIDQHNRPVPKFKMMLGVSHTSIIPFAGLDTKRIRIRTDSRGHFDVTGEDGFSLKVFPQTVDNYIVNQELFYYRNQAGLTPPDTAPDNPYAIRVYKREPQLEIPLIVNKVKYKFPPSDRTHTIDLVNNRRYPDKRPGDLWVTVSRDHKAERYGNYSWQVNLEVPDGGLIVTNDRMVYYAPDRGYQKSWLQKYRKGQKGWTNAINKNFYIKSRGGKIYARMKIYLSPYFSYDGNAYVRIKYWLNRSGSRNLYSTKNP